MPDLSQSLQGRDLGHLRIVAEMWGIEFDAPDTRVGFQRLVPALLNPQSLKEVIADLPAEARLALDDLLQNEGRMAWPLFTRRYGAVREMGPGRRDRDRPYLKPVSAAEMLWYRALVARSFFDAPGGPQEFAYIPDDLLPIIPSSQSLDRQPLGRPASPVERAHPHSANDFILDHACTLLAALRLGLPAGEIAALADTWKSSTPLLTPAALQRLLAAAGLLDDNGLPQPEPTRAFLEANRGEALALLARAWHQSDSFNDLRLTPGLRFEGEWENNPLQARRAVLDFLSMTPRGSWWSLPAFAAAIRQAHPDFQRPAGDYDSWFIRDETGPNEFLRGFEHWDDVDGALVRYIITGPLHWLGVVDVASPAEDAPPAAFRFLAWASDLLEGRPPQGLPSEEAPMLASSDARLRIPRLAPRAARYRAARFCTWDGERDGVYLYRITPASLARARQQGLSLAHLLSLLRRYAQATPPSLLKALERWDQHGVEARMEQALVLRVSSPEMLQALRASRAGRFLGDPLGPTSVIVKSGAREKVLLILAEMGYLGVVEAGE
ncbi:MAG: hypothetical protein EHM70_04500 [Chloroflexota bacterium]|nr:MAG: hypothetical protein EHM70_04500 [Chloroflexota bacterium]